MKIEAEGSDSEQMYQMKDALKEVKNPNVENCQQTEHPFLVSSLVN